MYTPEIRGALHLCLSFGFAGVRRSFREMAKEYINKVLERILCDVDGGPGEEADLYRQQCIAKCSGVFDEQAIAASTGG